MSQPSVSTFALLYSNCPLKDTVVQQLLNRTREVIQKDKILSDSIHLICIDNKYTRDIMTHNSSGVTVYNWPVFAVRKSDKNLEVYPLTVTTVDEIFNSVYQTHNKLSRQQGRKVIYKKPPKLTNSGGSLESSEYHTIAWNSDNFECPRKISIHVGDTIRFRSTDGLPHNLVEINSKQNIAFRNFSKKFDQSIKFSHPGTYRLISTKYPNMLLILEVKPPEAEAEAEHELETGLEGLETELEIDDNDHQIDWNFKNFLPNGKIRELIVDYGDKILFSSRDGKIHDVSFADKNWNVLSQIVPPKKNMKEIIIVDEEHFETPAIYHLVSSENPERFRLRLKIPPKMKVPTDRSRHVIRIDRDKIPQKKEQCSELGGYESDPYDKIFDGLTDNRSELDDISLNKPKKTTFAQRRKFENAPKIEKGTNEYSAISMTTEIIEGISPMEDYDDNIEMVFSDDDLSKLEEMTELLKKHI